MLLNNEDEMPSFHIERNGEASSKAFCYGLNDFTQKDIVPINVALFGD